MKDHSTFLAIIFTLGLISCAPAVQNEQLARPASTIASFGLRASEMLNSMSIEENIGQVIQADIASVTPQEVTDNNLDSILNGGTCGVTRDNEHPVRKICQGHGHRLD